mmetsp:Transcript_13755/g.20343  ORF Transcript_13755/g.20343 Transcript_13755/m.20343 type:complete len:117 (-) Transcript_13755:1282-1632(-)
MVLTDRQRSDLHAGIHEYLLSRGEKFAAAAAALALADPDACAKSESSSSSTTPLLEKKWTAVPRLQRKVLELERAVSTNASYHAHRSSITSGTVSNGNSNEGDGNRRMIPRPPTFK